MNIQFVVGNNDLDFYKFMNENGQLPDIITSRRFSLHDAAALKDQLMDLSTTEQAGMIYDSYLGNFTNTDGSVNWLPMCGEVSGCTGGSDRIQISMYLWDKSLSKQLTPWLEEKFPEIDFTFVVGYNTMDFYSDLNKRGNLPDIITCRRFSLNDAAHMSDLLMDLSETDVAGSFYDSYIENNRETSGAIRWLPMCAEVDGYVANADMFAEYGVPIPKNYAQFAEACRRFEELGIRCYVNDYREDYSCMEALQGCAIPELMTMDGVMWRSAYESESGGNQVGLDSKVWQTVFEKFAQLSAQKNTDAPEVVTTQKTAYDYDFGGHGSPAASAVVNTLRRQWGSEIAVGYSSVITAPVYAGDYTRQQLNWLLANKLVLRSGELTGAELKQFMEWLVNAKNDGENPIRHSNLIPVTSGMEYTLTDNGDRTYSLGEITINGSPLDENRVYSVMMVGDNSYIEAEFYCNCPMPQELNDKMAVMDDNIYTLFYESLNGGNQLEPPTEYVTVQQ